MEFRVSLFYLVGLFDLWVGIRTLLISSTGAYLIAAKIRGPYMPWIGFVFLMGHMSISHILRQHRETPEVVDISGRLLRLAIGDKTKMPSRCADGPCDEGTASMLFKPAPLLSCICIQLSAFCWNVHDGQLPQEGLSEFQRDRAIRELPGLLDYAGYVVRPSPFRARSHPELNRQ